MHKKTGETRKGQSQYQNQAVRCHGTRRGGKSKIQKGRLNGKCRSQGRNQINGWGRAGRSIDRGRERRTSGTELRERMDRKKGLLGKKRTNIELGGNGASGVEVLGESDIKSRAWLTAGGMTLARGETKGFGEGGFGIGVL